MTPHTFPITLGLVLVILGLSVMGAWLMVLLFSLIGPPTGPARGVKAARFTTNNLNLANARPEDDVQDIRISRTPRARPLRISKRQEDDADDDRATREWPPAVRGGAAARVFDRPANSLEARRGEPDDTESEVEL